MFSPRPGTEHAVVELELFYGALVAVPWVQRHSRCTGGGSHAYPDLLHSLSLPDARLCPMHGTLRRGGAGGSPS